MSELSEPKHASATPEKRTVPAWAWVLGVLLTAGGAYAFWNSSQAATPVAINTPTAKATTGNLDVRITLTGQTTAKRFSNVSAPKLNGPEGDRPLVLTKLIDHGVPVKRGALLAQIDPGGLIDHIDDVQAMVEGAKADIAKRKAEQSVESETLQQTLRVAKADLEKARLDLRTSELKTTLDREILQLAVEEADARFNQLGKDVAIRARIHAAEIATLVYTQRRHERHVQRHDVDLKNFSMYAPIDGRAVIQQTWSGDSFRLIRLGDRVFPGFVFAKVVDAASLVLEGLVSQVDSSRLQLGQAAQLTFDAFPGLNLPGSVESIGAIATRSWRQQYFIRNIKVAVALQDQNDRVIPDLSGAASVTLARIPNQVLVPRQAVFQTSGKSFVYVRTGQGPFEKRPVELGESNDLQTAIRQGVRAGDEVAISEPVLVAGS